MSQVLKGNMFYEVDDECMCRMTEQNNNFFVILMCIALIDKDK